MPDPHEEQAANRDEDHVVACNRPSASMFSPSPSTAEAEWSPVAVRLAERLPSEDQHPPDW